ncbi:MAG: hypothetical protein PWQ91_1482 [Eubacteriales bacterium]|nr:hypothetical protein [Eubacteriales bacterium]MDN5364420.1 hypothetical protein [Eubacteriales bacterium]
MGRINIWEILVITFIILLIFGPRRLAGLGRSLGEAIRGFRSEVTREEANSGDEQREKEKVE